MLSTLLGLPSAAPQQRPIAALKMSGLLRLLYRNSNSATYSGRYLRLTLWNEPMIPRFNSDQKGDRYAISDCWEFEYAEVYAMETETPTCVRIGFYEWLLRRFSARPSC